KDVLHESAALAFEGFATAISQASVESIKRLQEEAEPIVLEALNVARRLGYSLDCAELLSIRGRLRLHQGRPSDAIDDALTALFGQHPPRPGEKWYEASPRKERESADRQQFGISPPLESGLPELLGLMHSDFGDVWCELDCREIVAE